MFKAASPTFAMHPDIINNDEDDIILTDNFDNNTNTKEI